MNGKGFFTLPLGAGLLGEYTDGNFTTGVYGVTPDEAVDLPVGYTYMGLVVHGEMTIMSAHRVRHLVAGDFYSVVGPAQIVGSGHAVLSSVQSYTGFNLCGGPIEDTGRLRYIDGCTDTMLVPPVRKGDACLNHLHFPPHTVQTAHTHPSVRVNVVYRGSGVCVVENAQHFPLVPGYAFVMGTDTIHHFLTEGECMDVITFHPDSDTGATDDDHPMVNRTVVNGVSAVHIPEIRTQGV